MKAIFKKIIYRLYYRFDNLLNYFANIIIEKRIKNKISKKYKINILFICWRPSIWESLKPIYEELLNDNRYNVTILAIPNKKQVQNIDYNHEIYESEGAEEFWKEYKCINGYDYSTKKWFNIKKIKPDFVFFQQPYNIARYKKYNSFYVSKYSKICYITYHGVFSYNNVYLDCLPKDFMNDVSYFFAQNEDDRLFLEKHRNELFNNNTKIINTGYPRFYSMSRYKNDISSIWNNTQKKYRILWNTRWTTNEGNCNFFKYKDKMLDLCKRRSDIDFVFRPHPQAFLEWESTNEFSKEEQIEFRRKIDEMNNMHIDESKNYYSLIYSSDVLISDYSSFMLDYFITGKPIIYCEVKDCSVIGNDMGVIDRVTYKAHDWEEVENILNLLIDGGDYLKNTRKNELYNNYSYQNNPAKKIIETLYGETK